MLGSACDFAGIAITRAHVADPPATNNSLAVRYNAAVDFLVSNGYVSAAEGKHPKYRLTEKGRSAVPEDLKESVPEPVFMAFASHPPPAAGIRRRISLGERSFALREAQAEASRKLEAAVREAEDRHVADVVARATAFLAKTPLSRLHQQFTNVSAKADDPDWKISRSARGIMAAIVAERERREGLVPGSGRREGAFHWPRTDAFPGLGDSHFEIDAEKSGILSASGYAVGHTRGEAEDRRRETLCKLFEGDLPEGDFPDEYRLSWGGNASAARLRKIAYTIAAMTRNFKRRDLAVLERAIGEWEADLQFLHDAYYVGKFTFEWPETDIGSSCEEEASPSEGRSMAA